MCIVKDNAIEARNISKVVKNIWDIQQLSMIITEKKYFLNLQYLFDITTK